jgi:hypothetical protein
MMITNRFAIISFYKWYRDYSQAYYSNSCWFHKQMVTSIEILGRYISCPTELDYLYINFKKTGVSEQEIKLFKHEAKFKKIEVINSVKETRG